MNDATEKPTPRQRHRLRQLLLSSVFTAEEAHRASEWLASPAATKDRASEVITDALSRIEARDNAQKDFCRTARPNITPTKSNGGGEYPPRRYSNENPPPNGDSANEPPPEPPPEDTPAPAPAPEAEQEPTIYRINGVDYTRQE